MDLIKNEKVIFFIIPFIIYITLLTCIPLVEPDEGRYSAIPREMNLSGDYISPHLKGTVYLEKPPLCYWATALSFKIFGENEFSSRLFTTLCAWGCILLVYSIGTFYYDTKTGFYAAAVLTTSLYHFTIGRINVLDMPLAFFVSLAIWLGYRYLSGGEERRKKRLYLFYLFCALAFLTKGLIGIVFPFAIIVIWLLFSKRWHDIPKIFSIVGIIIFLVLTGPWLIYVQMANKDFFWFFFVQEHFLRYTTTIHSRNQPFYFFAPIIIAGTLPWCAFLLKAVKESGIRIVALYSTEKLFLLIWAGFIFLFFSVSSSKLISYIAPVFLPIAVFIGHIFRVHDDTWNRNLNTSRISGILYHLPVIFQSLLFIAVLFTPSFVVTSSIFKSHYIPLRIWWPWVIIPFILQIMILILPDLIRRKWGKGWFVMVYALSFLFLSVTTFPISKFLAPYKTAYPIAQAIQNYVPADREVYQYRMSLYGIDFYTHMRTPVVDDIGELQPGVEKLPPEEKARYFLTSDEFFKLYREMNDIYCVTEHKNMQKLKKETLISQVLWENGYYYLLHLKKSD